MGGGLELLTSSFGMRQRRQGRVVTKPWGNSRRAEQQRSEGQLENG